VAGEAQAAFMSIGPSDVLSKFVGESEASIKHLFAEGKRILNVFAV
jgi:SpoVK/Ycf46/Vps4 family AAA+-type ATPase